MARSTWLVILIKNIYTLWSDPDQEYIYFMGSVADQNIYTLWGRKRLLHFVANF